MGSKFLEPGGGCARSAVSRRMLEVVPQAAQIAQGSVSNRPETGERLNMLATAACYCGPGRAAGPRYTCITCLGFARIGQRIEARAPHRYQEERGVAS